MKAKGEKCLVSRKDALKKRLVTDSYYDKEESIGSVRNHQSGVRKKGLQ